MRKRRKRKWSKELEGETVYKRGMRKRKKQEGGDNNNHNRKRIRSSIMERTV